MILEIIIPDLGATGGDVMLNEWLVQPGDTVTAGQPLFVVETDKATVEVEAFRDGVIRELRAEAGSTLAPGTVVALLADSIDEAVSAKIPQRPDQPGPITAPPSSPRQAAGSVAHTTKERILASPLARRIAEKEGIDLASLAGSGNQRQILKRDVMAALKTRPARRTTPLPIGARRQSLSPMRRAVAERTRRSKSEAPHFYVTIAVDMLAALDMLKQVAAWAEKQGWMTPTITDLCIRAAALTLHEFPALNASFDNEAIIIYSDINIGLVIGLDEGMLVPVIQRADELNLYTLAQTTQHIKQQATAGQLNASQLAGGTFTLSNLGMFGVDSFTAVLNPPQAGIVALGAVKEQPAVIGGEVVPRPMMTATLSVDHRVVDGIMAARFVQSFKEMLENPVCLILDAPTEAKS